MTTKARRPLQRVPCEASGVWVPASGDGAWGGCPLCLRVYGRTKAGRLRAHGRRWPRPMTRDEVFDRLQGIRR